MVHQGAENNSLAATAEEAPLLLPQRLLHAKIYTAAEMTEAEVMPLAGRQVAVVSLRSPTKQSANEDAAAIIPWGADAGVLVVADGLGGAALGREAAELAVLRLQVAIEQADPELMILRTAILNGIEAANRDILELGRGAATTLAVVEVTGDTFRPYHVGDSGILACGGRGKIKLQTTAHSPVGYGVEAGFLDEDDALHHEDRHVVSNVVGASNLRIEIGSEQKFAPRDTLLLASDGLFDNLQVTEIVDLLRKGSVEDACNRLANTAIERMREPTDARPSKADDLTVVVWR